MAAGMPELGSKISLISKADIRYEGRLFTVDPAECTIALANVRSYGTEDREAQYPISPQNQVYDYILFRGSDIKDIRVVNNVPALPNDPAIMQMQLPNQHIGQPPFQPPQFAAGPMGGGAAAHMANVMGGPPPFGGPYGAMGAMGGLAAAGLPPGSLPANTGTTAAGLSKVQQQKQSSELNTAILQPSSTTVDYKDQGGNAAVLEMIGGGSRSTTPVSLNSRKSPTNDMGVQVNKSIMGNKDGGGNNVGNNKRNNQNRGPRERRDSGRDNQNEPRQQQQNHQQQHQQHRNQQQQHYNNIQQQQQQQQNRGWMHRGGNMRGGNNNGNGSMGNRPRGPGGRGPPMQQIFRQNLHSQNNKGRPPKTTIKFESDYDFEQANNKFEELRLELISKLKVGEEAKPEQVNGETEKKDDSGNETGAGEHEQEDDDVNVGYDKTKSFFDNISCEAATDRTKGKNRTDWRHERKINSETFGVSSARRGSFYYRGRGSYFNRNMNIGSYRGNSSGGIGNGGNQGYRTNNYNRGRNYNRNYMHHSGGTGIPQQPSKPEQPGSGSTIASTPTAPATTSSTAGGVAPTSAPATVAAGN